MKQRTGSPRPYLASSATEKTLAANSQRRSHSVLAALEKCRAALLANADQETARLVSLAMLQLRMRMNKVGDADLKALCDAMTQDEAAVENSKQPQAEHRHFAAALKLVK
jgi:hypothetical protein